MSQKPDPNDKKSARQEKLAAALRANLQRRKAAKRAATAAKKDAE